MLIEVDYIVCLKKKLTIDNDTSIINNKTLLNDVHAQCNLPQDLLKLVPECKEDCEGWEIYAEDIEDYDVQFI